MKVVKIFLEQPQFEFVPVFHGLQGRFAAEGCLRLLLVVEADIVVPRGFQLFRRISVEGLKYLLSAAIGTFEHAVCLGRFRLGEAMLDTELDAELVELVFPSRRALV